MARHEVKSEKPLHHAIREHDIAEGAAKGAVTGTVIGAGLKHLGAKHVGPLSGAAAGTLLGVARGHFKGKERVLKDTTQQERVEARRMKKASLQAFADELQKLAAPVGFLEGVGSKLVGYGSRAVKAVSAPGSGLRSGYAGALQKGQKLMGNQHALNKAIGGVAAGTAAAGAGYVGYKALS